MVDNTHKVSQTQGEILLAIAKFMNITEIAKYRKCSRQAVYKVISKLLEKGLIEKIGSVYGLTERGRGGLHSFMGFTHKLRQHNISFKIQVLTSPRNWDKKRSQITTLPYFNKRVELQNNEYELFNFGRIKIKTTTKSVIFGLPTIYASDVDEAVIQAMDFLYQTIPKVEAQFKIRLVKDRKANIKIISQEYARLEDALAKRYKKEGKKLYITDADGKVWLIADYSFNVNELETISPDRADEDMDAIHPFLNDLRDNPTTFSEVRDILTQQSKIVGGIQQNQLVFDQNMKSHLKVLNDIGEAVNRLSSKIEELSKTQDFDKKFKNG